MKFEIKVMILSALMMSIALSFMSIEKSFAQSDDADNNNAISQKGEGNRASQSESSSQLANQNSMCVSGESTSLSCNNLSSESNGIGIRGEQGPPGPQGERGPQGEPGKDGATGPMGPDGSQGPQGAIGPIGSQGPKGETGATGAVGPQGPSGPQSVDGKVYYGPLESNSGNPALAFSSCSPGDTVIGGSFQITKGFEDDFDQIISSPATENRWAVQVRGTDDNAYFVSSIAICFDNP